MLRGEAGSATHWTHASAITGTAARLGAVGVCQALRAQVSDIHIAERTWPLIAAGMTGHSLR